MTRAYRLIFSATGLHKKAMKLAVWEVEYKTIAFYKQRKSRRLLTWESIMIDCSVSLMEPAAKHQYKKQLINSKNKKTTSYLKLYLI
jgi:hypothetical protein